MSSKRSNNGVGNGPLKKPKPDKLIHSQVWSRRPVPQGLPSRPTINLQQLDIEEAISARTGQPIVRIIGVTEEGNSILVEVINFKHYFYVPAPYKFTPHDAEQFASQLRDQFALAHIELCERKTLVGYTGPDPQFFLKIVAKTPHAIPALRRYFEVQQPNARLFRDFQFSTITFDRTTFVERLCIDRNISGMSWLTLPEHKYQVSQGPPISRCQIEVSIDYRDMVSHSPSGDWLGTAPIRILSFDIECAGRKGIFPEANKDPVIQIGNVAQVQGSSEVFAKNVFVTGTCAPIAGADVLSFDTEQEMLLAWKDFVNELDPDIIIGYNIANFDFPYLIERAAALQLKTFPYFGRLLNQEQKIGRAFFQSKAFGSSENKSTDIHGRVQIDMLQYIRREYKLRTYTLNAVSGRFLNEQKEDVPHSIITTLHNGNEFTRNRLATYCLKDAYLPMRLMHKLMALVNMTEMARVTGVPLAALLSRGQQVKVMSQLFRKALEVGMVLPNYKQEEGAGYDQYEGATVIEPVRGYYDSPISTLDFSSLYPSIMMAHNLCYTTLLKDPKASIAKYNLTESDYIKTPTGDYFVKPNKQEGILPIILKELIAARKQAKADLKKETDPFKRAVLDGRQLALKISANSVYGFTGATVGRLPCLEISSSVTAFGRDMIEATKNYVEENYTKEKGYEFDSQVIYGDTDSVMVKFGPKDLKECMRLGEEAAGRVSKIFQNPIKLEFEKVYFPYLLINKKRYAGLYWTRPEKHDKMDTKGIETVRRDNCQLVQNVIETVLNRILISRDVKSAELFVKDTISDLLQNRVDISQLIITKQISKADYAGKQAHVELAERMRKRDSGSAPQLGDRVPYVIIKAGPNERNYDKSEDPQYVLEHNIPIDTNYYLDNQLSKPLMRIFEPILGEHNAKALLHGWHTNKVMKATPTTGGLMKFVAKTELCKGCKKPLKGKYAKGAVCEDCQDKIPELYCQQLADINELQVQFARLWTECQRCEQSLHSSVQCSSNDCPIFYRRVKARKELERGENELAKFDINSW